MPSLLHSLTVTGILHNTHIPLSNQFLLNPGSLKETLTKGTEFLPWVELACIKQLTKIISGIRIHGTEKQTLSSYCYEVGDANSCDRVVNSEAAAVNLSRKVPGSD